MSDAALRRLFFVHVMKTGGTAVGWNIGRSYGPDASFPPDDAGPGSGDKVTPARLLALESATRRRLRFVSVHMPAWVAFAMDESYVKATVLREPVARTVSHLRHIARLLGGDPPLEELYDQPRWRSRLRNYQTRFFAESRKEYEARFAGRAEVAAEVRDELPALSEDELADVRRALYATWATAVTDPAPLDADAVAAAADRLDAFDEVGTTDRIEPFAHRLASRIGMDVDDFGVINAASDPPAPSRALLRRIEADNELDAVLYERARSRAG